MSKRIFCPWFLSSPHLNSLFSFQQDERKTVLCSVKCELNNAINSVCPLTSLTSVSWWHHMNSKRTWLCSQFNQFSHMLSTSKYSKNLFWFEDTFVKYHNLYISFLCSSVPITQTFLPWPLPKYVRQSQDLCWEIFWASTLISGHLPHQIS